MIPTTAAPPPAKPLVPRRRWWLRGTLAADLVVSPAGAQGGNTTVRVGEALFLKICRKLQPGINPGVEIGRYLTEVAHFRHSVPLAGFVEYRHADAASFDSELDMERRIKEARAG